MGITDPIVKVHVEMRTGLQSIDLSKVSHRCLPDNAAINAAAGVAASLRKKGVKNPFPMTEPYGECCACMHSKGLQRVLHALQTFCLRG